jgi:hypothetical protein
MYVCMSKRILYGFKFQNFVNIVQCLIFLGSNGSCIFLICI